MSIQAVLETMLAFLNHFPLFAIMLRFKDPERLPGGLRFGLLPPTYVAKHILTDESVRAQVAIVKKGRPRGTSISAQSSALITATAAAAEQIIRRRRRSSVAQNVTIDKPLVRPSVNASLRDNGYVEDGQDHGHSLRHADLAVTDITYMDIENLPIRLPSIFFQYIALGHRAMNAVLTSEVLRRFASGETMVPLARLQHSLLPATRQVFYDDARPLLIHRPSMAEFWACLNNPSAAQGRNGDAKGNLTD